MHTCYIAVQEEKRFSKKQLQQANKRCMLIQLHRSMGKHIEHSPQVYCKHSPQQKHTHHTKYPALHNTFSVPHKKHYAHSGVRKQKEYSRMEIPGGRKISFTQPVYGRKHIAARTWYSKYPLNRTEASENEEHQKQDHSDSQCIFYITAHISTCDQSNH